MAAIPTNEFNSPDVRFQAKRMFVKMATMGAIRTSEELPANFDKPPLWNSN